MRLKVLRLLGFLLLSTPHEHNVCSKWILASRWTLEPFVVCYIDTVCSLSARPKKLAELDTKLSILWGNLHERKLALQKEGISLPLPVGDEKLGLSNLPFECCVEEYGVPVNEKGVPYTNDEIKALIKDMNEGSEPALKILGNPKTWKRTWSPHNTTIKMDL